MFESDALVFESDALAVESDILVVLITFSILIETNKNYKNN